jgi:hypothetical protein
VPDGAERHDVRAGGGRHEEPERDAADLDALPQCVRHAGKPDRPRRVHDRRAPACPVRVHRAVTVAAVPMVVAAAAGARGVKSTDRRARWRCDRGVRGRSLGREQRRPRRGCRKVEAPERRGTDDTAASAVRSCIAAAAAATADWGCCLAGQVVMALD